MKRTRRDALVFVGSAVAAATIPRIAQAQAYPSRAVRIIVGFTPGGGNDIVARLIGQWLSERLGQPFVVENRPGAGSNIGAQAVVHAAPDGYTLLLCGTTNTINDTYYPRLAFRFARDIAPVASITQQPQVLLTHPNFRTKTLAELIDYAKANPGKINMSSAGVGSIGHLAGELLQQMSGIKLTHVPFGGNSPALTALLGEQVDVSFASLPSSVEYIRTGKLRGLAVTSAKRLEVLPDVPAGTETVPGYEVAAWYAVGAPKDTPAAIVERLNKEINLGLDDPKLRARIAEFGGSVMQMSPPEFGKFVNAETEKWAKVIRAANIRSE